MKIAIFPDKFRGSLTATEAFEALKKGVLRANPTAEVCGFGMADGGEGTLGVFEGQFQKIELEVQDPLGRPISSYFLFDKVTQTAFVELALSAGLSLLKPSEYDALNTHTFGVGQTLLKALTLTSKIVLFVGGSATTDAGLGAAAALGCKYLDKNKSEVLPSGANLSRVDSIVPPDHLPKIELTIATDVTNPFYGFHGAAHMYAQQKGASNSEIEILDHGLRNMATVFEHQFSIDVQHLAGSGAAGGIAGGLSVLFGAKIISGFEFLAKHFQMEDIIQKADVLYVAEGKADDQTLSGKLPFSLAQMAHKHKKAVVLFCGKSELNDNAIFSQVHSILDKVGDPEISLKNAAFELENLSYCVTSAL